MLFTTALASLSLLGLALAQDNTTVVTIQVGATAQDQGGIFQFIPPSVNVANGTVVNFRFTGMPGNHSITQSTFANPCTPAPGGFDSGWVYLPTAGLSPVPEFNLTITDDSRPIWFFCKQLQPAPHCIAGMVGAINPPASGNTFANYQAAARAAQSVDQSEGSLVGIGASASARPNPIPSGATPFPAITNVSPSGSSGTGTGSGSAPSGTAGSSGAITLSVSSAAVALMAGMTGVLLA